MIDLQDLTALILANTPLIVIETRDEERVVELFRQILMRVWRVLFRWSITKGMRRIDIDRDDDPHVASDASATLQAIREADQRDLYLLFNAQPYLGYAGTQRQLRDILQRRNCQPHVLVLVGHKIELPICTTNTTARASTTSPARAASSAGSSSAAACSSAARRRPGWTCPRACCWGCRAAASRC